MKKLAIIVVAILALFTRLWQISRLPPHLSNDEISIAYDAYSLAESGKNMQGKSYPILFESTGAYKAPVYMYGLAPLVKT